MKDDNYIHICGWMINRLELSGTPLMIYAIIYGFSQDGESWFDGSISYLKKSTGKGRSAVIANLNSLVEQGLIIKRSEKVNGVIFNKYKSVPPVRKPDHPPSGNRTTPRPETGPNNTSEDNTNGYNKSELENSLFPDFTIDKKKKTIYRNCDLKKEGVLEQVFKNEIAAGIDVEYYATKVERWSNKREGIKRGFYGWRDTIADFMDGDRKDKKLQMLETEQKEESEFARRYREKVDGMK